MNHFNTLNKANNEITFFWFRRDLRLDDNTALTKALANHKNVQPIFIFDQYILDDIENKNDRRLSFIYETIESLKLQLDQYNSDLWVYYGYPESVFEKLFIKYGPKAIYFNHDYEPYAIERDDKISKLADKYNVSLHSFKDQVIYEKLELVKNNGSAYTVFTPYMKKWMQRFLIDGIFVHDEVNFSNFNLCSEQSKLMPLDFIGFNKVDHLVAKLEINNELIKNYQKTRDLLYKEKGTSRLSVHLRFGTISIRKLVAQACQLNNTYLKELIWREFYMQILYNFPNVVTENFKPAYNHIVWNTSYDDFKRWCNAETGYPIVDAAMNQLLETGFMHNRARMIVASFLCKHLLIDWRKGEAFFARHLTDYELSSNNGGWQWAASTGCDAVPYFRIFNPYIQANKFDKDGYYIDKWSGNKGIKPMVDHKHARARAIEAYKKALNKSFT